MFVIEFSACAKRFLRKIDHQLAARIIHKIEGLAEEPFPTDVKRIANRKEKIFRVRVGDYRIQYVVSYSKNLVYISNIDKRGRAY